MKNGVGILCRSSILSLLNAEIEKSSSFRVVISCASPEPDLSLVARLRPLVLVIELRHPIYPVQDLMTELRKRKIEMTYIFFHINPDGSLIYTHTCDESNPLIRPLEQLFLSALQHSFQCIRVYYEDLSWERFFHSGSEYWARQEALKEILRGVSYNAFLRYKEKYHLNLNKEGFFLLISLQTEGLSFDHGINKSCFNLIFMVWREELEELLNQLNGGEIIYYSPIEYKVIINNFEMANVNSMISKRNILMEKFKQITRRKSGICFVSDYIEKIESMCKVCALFDEKVVNHFFCSEKNPIAMAELDAGTHRKVDYPAIQQLLEKIGDSITFGSDISYTITCIEELFLRHLKHSFEVDLYYYCFNVIKNFFIQMYGYDETFILSLPFSSNLTFDSIEHHCSQIISMLNSLNQLNVGVSTPKRNHNEVVSLSIRYIKENYMNALSAQSIADAIHVNSAYLGQVFKKKTGVSITRFISDFRIKKAIAQLRQSKKSVSEISSLVGFQSVQYFAKVFKMQTGFTPTEYRFKEALK